MSLEFNRNFDPCHGRVVEVAPGIRRLTARNAGPYTFKGTNSWIIGTSELIVVDPGPEDSQHVAELLQAAGKAPIRTILITHTHRDHSPAAALLKSATGAEIVGAGPHVFSRPLHEGEVTGLDASADKSYRPDRVLADGETFTTAGTTLRTIATPGHTQNHLCFAIEDSDWLISGDHVMGWSTSIVAPPDGSMGDYMASLDRLLRDKCVTYLPGHGDIIANAQSHVEGLRDHRYGREAAIRGALGNGPRSIAAMVREVYADTDPKLHAAAGLSMFAQLEWMVSRGSVLTEGAPRLDSLYRLA
ncbi:MBL fold metallo-hydrolase [Oryzibacter oryziterrae]|uniref:MBL fold metallo-hydrolase n=1 Tax=Oryzibacter oryziterrae TaxID=2766474 RepID=UPI001F2FF648|nr:MBL fold metallo-hydrolase [Oryzibacter oryziterrae]